MDSLPSELLLYLIPFLPLTSLIVIRGVNTRWRSFVQTATLHHARKALLDLYLASIDHPNFPSLVNALRPHVREFDREAYIAELTSRGCVLPDVFEVWVLEWPSKAVHFWAWPGLTQGVSVDHEYYHGNNLLGPTTFTIDTIPVPKDVSVDQEYYYDEDEGDFLDTSGIMSAVGMIPVPKDNAEGMDMPVTCRGLALWNIDCSGSAGEPGHLWLVVDADERINDRRAGALLWTHTFPPDGPDGIGEPLRLSYVNPISDDLIQFLNLLDRSRVSVEETLDELCGLYESGLLGDWP